MRDTEPVWTQDALDIRVTAHFLIRAGCGERPLTGRANILDVPRQRAGLVARWLWLERFSAVRQLGFRQLHIDGALFGIDGDDVAIFDEADGAHVGGFRPDMADAKAARRAREAAVGDQGDILRSLPI